MRRLYVHTLGCPKNDADSRTLARSLTAAGVSIVDEPETATHILVNTCGFIKDAKEESIAAILDACAEPGGKQVLVMGCLVERYRKELAEGIPEVAGWFGLGDEQALVALLADEEARVAAGPDAAFAGAEEGGAVAESGAQPHGDRLLYAYVKISDGCDEPCTFCAIPGIKGPYHSVDTATILAEVGACLTEGAREIILVGQDTAVWRDGDRDLRHLLELVAADERLLRLRVMYLQPEHLTDALLEYMAGAPKLCRYLDVPFQHADAEVLRRMGRWGDGRAYRDLVTRARRLMPGVSLRSTFIVGFPGETEAQFESLLDFVDDIGFDHAGGFVYSPEEGTVGATLRPRIKRKVALDRLNRLSALLEARAEAEHRRLVDTTLEVMLDVVAPEEEGVAAIGRTEGQAPEIDGVTYIEGVLPPGAAPGDIVRVTVTDAVGHDLIGRCDAA